MNRQHRRHRPHSRLRRLACGTLVLSLLGTACGAPGARQDSASGSGHYPVTITNCGADVTVDARPERVVLLESSPVSTLRALDVLDAVTVRAGAFPAGYYDDETNAAIRSIPSLGEELDTSGHLQLSVELVVAQRPDLVLGLPDGVPREALAELGIPVLVHPTLCPTGAGATTFDDVADQVTTYGRLFDREDRAAELVDSLRRRITAVEQAVQNRPRRTAAVLYPTIGGGTVYAYGNESMAHPQLDSAGFTNVYGDVEERVFEVTVEDLIAKDPDVLVLLHTDGDPDAVEDAVAELPGADALRAVRHDAILVQLFNFTEPPTPLSVTGLERIHERFGGES